MNAQGDAALLLMDDFRGRSAARHAGFALIGTTGLLLLAKHQGAVDAIKPSLLALRQQGYFLSDRRIASALEQVGEAYPSGTRTSLVRRKTQTGSGIAGAKNGCGQLRSSWLHCRRYATQCDRCYDPFTP
jgi:hypothetical protein